MATIKFIDTQIGAYSARKGDYNLAEWLILTSNLSNKEIAVESGIGLHRVSPLVRTLRMKARR